ncbi:hypothetical protein L2E82_38755 [Cichorium intybus]|uniref:Uncharacterized protein n=1 Tax=Cichorium intybus TaxID=13427 RepID=A0ACB9AHF7_CICIN|nr:hypothetical protein L2E82_38755 [Cichorium intybus]
MTHDRFFSLPRSNSCTSTTAIVPSNDVSSTSFIVDPPSVPDKPLVGKTSPVGYGCCIPKTRLYLFFIFLLLTRIKIRAQIHRPLERKKILGKVGAWKHQMTQFWSSSAKDDAVLELFGVLLVSIGT